MSLKTLLCLFVSLFLFLTSQCYAVPPKLNPVPSDYHTGLSWEEAQKSDKPMVVNFYVDWCGACRRFAPNFDKLRKEFEEKYNFVIVRTDDPQNTKIIRQFSIYSYPSVFIIDKKNDQKIFVDQKKYSKLDEMREVLNTF